MSICELLRGEFLLISSHCQRLHCDVVWRAAHQVKVQCLEDLCLHVFDLLFAELPVSDAFLQH